MSRSRGYCFVVNNYTDDVIAQLMDLAETEYVSYIVVGFEIAPTTGTPHIQGYMHFTSGRTMRSVCDRVDHISLQDAKAEGENFDRRYTYCMKTDKGGSGDFWEYGIRPQNGVNTSTTKVVAAIKEGKTLKELMDLFPSYMIHHKHKVISYMNDIAPEKKTEYYVIAEGESMNETIQVIHEHFNGLDKVAVVTDLYKLATYREYSNVIYFCDEYERDHTLWPYGAPLAYKYGYEMRPINCDRLIIVTNTPKLYSNYKKIKI